MAVRLWGNQFQVNGTSTNNQSDSSVAALSGGGFVVTWHDDMGTADDRVYFQRYDALGQAQGGPTLVPSDGGPQDLPTITAYNDGGFIIGVRDFDGASNYDAMGYRYTAAGVLQETLTSTAFVNTPSTASFADKGLAGANNVIYVTYSLFDPGSGDIVLGFRTPGNATYSTVFANTLSAVDQRDPTIAKNSLVDSSFVAVAWVSDAPGNEEIKLRVYDGLTGQFKTTAEITIDSDLLNLGNIQLCWLSGDVVAISYTDGDPGFEFSHVQLYSVVFGTTTNVVLPNALVYKYPVVTALGDGRFAVCSATDD